MGALISIGATKGVYITTSSFTNEARKVCASSPHVKLVLIDGIELANYMIKYNVGVIADHSYVIKRVDSGFSKKNKAVTLNLTTRPSDTSPRGVAFFWRSNGHLPSQVERLGMQLEFDAECAEAR